MPESTRRLTPQMKHMLAEIRASRSDMLPVARFEKLPHRQRTVEALERRGIIRRTVRRLDGDIYQLCWEEVMELVSN